jgi:hypothetical protein
MSFLDSIKNTGAIKSLSMTGSLSIRPSDYRGITGANGMWQFLPDGHDVFFTYGGYNSALAAYTSCPPLTAIINRKAQAYINGKTFILNKQGKAKNKEATGEIANKIRKLISRPNPLQSWKQFEAQNYIYQQLSGFCVVLPLKPTGFDNTYATTLWNVPPWMLEIKEKVNVNFLLAKDIRDLVESVHVVYNSQRTQLPLDDIFIFKDFSPAVDSIAFPDSRIRSLVQPINNLIGLYESMGVIIDKRGPSMVISSGKTDDSGVIALQPKEKTEIEKQFMERFGLRRQQSRAIITSAPIKLDTVGFSTQELMLIELAQDAIMRLCDGFVYPYQLMASDRNNSLGGNNADPFKKLLYQDTIIPEAESMYEQWESFFSLVNTPITIQKDYRHIAALQDNQVEAATARFQRNRAALLEFQNNVLTLNEWRELNNDDPLENGLGDLYYYELVAQGITFGQGVSGASVPDNVNPNSNTSSQNQNNGSNNNA